MKQYGRVMRHQPARSMNHLNDHIMRLAGIDHIVAHNTADVVTFPMPGVAKGNALVTIHQQIALYNRV